MSVTQYTCGLGACMVDTQPHYFLSLFLGFPTERWEMEIVASKFERNGLIDYKEFVNSLKNKKPVSYDVSSKIQT